MTTENLVTVGGDGGGRGRATVQMPRLLQFYYKVGAGRALEGCARLGLLSAAELLLPFFSIPSHRK